MNVRALLVITHVPMWRVPLNAAVGVDMNFKMIRKLVKVCVVLCISLSLPEQALGWLPLGWGFTVEGEPSELY